MKNMALERAGARAAEGISARRSDRACFRRGRRARARACRGFACAEAVEGCGFVARRPRATAIRIFASLDVRDAAPRIVEESRRAPVAVLFGAERTGLTNEELEAAHVLIRIPGKHRVPVVQSRDGGTDRGLRDLSVRSWTPDDAQARDTCRWRRPAEMERLYEHLAQVMEEVDFRDRTQSGTNLMSRIRRFLQRAELDQNEANILRGFLTACRAGDGTAVRSERDANLSRLRGDDAGGSGRGAGDERMPRRRWRVRQCVVDHACDSAGARPRGSKQARAQVAALIGAQPRRDHLHFRRHRIQQSRDSRRRARERRSRPAYRHRAHGAQGGARSLQAPREGRLQRSRTCCRIARAHRVESGACRTACRHRARLHHAREQRNRRRCRTSPRSARSAASGTSLFHTRCGAVRRQSAARRRRVAGRFAVVHRAQDLRAEGHRRAVRSRRASRPRSQAGELRRRAGAGPAAGHVAHASDRGFRCRLRDSLRSGAKRSRCG